jgi:hypothetical protein
LGLVLAFYNQLIKPYVDLKISEIDYPPNLGDTFDYVMSDTDRFYNYSIGANTGNIITKCSSISENHLVFQFKKDSRNEDYQITVKKEGAVLFKPPRMNHYSKMAGSEKIESHEIIGKTAEFRISDKITKDRMIDFIEITLTANFFFDRMGRERMKFTFKITKIHPGFNLKQKNSKGLFPFGRDNAKASMLNDAEEEID